MGEQRSRRDFLSGGLAVASYGLAGCTVGGGNGNAATDNQSDTQNGGQSSRSSGSDAITVFHAGSLAPPFSAIEPEFEEEYQAEVTREAKGSVASTQKITQQRRSADILGVSDFRLIRDRILPEFGRWYTIFTTNSTAIQYRTDSPGADVISTDNWWEVLTRDDITIGHSDPAVDPGGYRAVMTQQLGMEEFKGERFYDRATYEKLRENSTVPTGTETNLEALLMSEELDYVFTYQSIGAISDHPFIDLQPEVDLSKATDEYARHYAKAEVETSSGTFTGAPIAYGMTVPNVADAPAMGARWVETVARDVGQRILENTGLVPVDPMLVPSRAVDAVPDRVMEVASAANSIGPLDL